MGVEFTDPRWAVPGLLPEGLNLIVGAPKVGKSWFGLDVAIAVARGSYALGILPVEGGDVLYLALEDTGRRLQSRLRIALGDSPPPERLTLETECPPLGRGAEVLIEEWVEAASEPRLIVVDVFAKVRGLPNGKVNQYDDDYQSMVKLKRLADRFGICILVVHHTRKAIATDYLDLVSGTNGIAGAADGILILTRNRGNTQATLKVTGRDVEEAEHTLTFLAEHGRWVILKPVSRSYDIGSTRQKVLHAVRAHGALTPTEIAVLCEITVTNAKQTCLRMASAGQLETDGKGTYTAPVD